MLHKSPSGALSPYYYKGGYFHGIHYGDYSDRSDELLSMMSQEEVFLLNSSERRRILIDLYHTDLTEVLTDKIADHIEKLNPRIVKLAIASDKKSLRRLQKSIFKRTSLDQAQLFFSTDMEEGKAWLVQD